MLRPRLIRVPGRVALPLRSTRTAAPPACRAIHTVPPLQHFNPEEGVPGLLSAQGFDYAWTQHMQLMLEKLNALVAGTEYEQMPVQQIVRQTARQAHEAPIFNHASMAFNNSLFFENIANLNEHPGRDEVGEQRMPEPLRREITRTFSSVETLRLEFLATAMGMFGPGFVWLVKNARSTELRILTTYLAGTPFTAAHWRRQGYDANTRGSDVNDSIVKEGLRRAQAGVNADRGSFDATAPGGTDTIPLLCLNTWQHVWLPDYGIGAGGKAGKRQFVENWWQCIDWDKVYNLAALNKPLRL